MERKPKPPIYLYEPDGSYNPEMVKYLKRIAKEPPERTFRNKEGFSQMAERGMTRPKELAGWYSPAGRFGKFHWFDGPGDCLCGQRWDLHPKPIAGHPDDHPKNGTVCLRMKQVIDQRASTPPLKPKSR